MGSFLGSFLGLFPLFFDWFRKLVAQGAEQSQLGAAFAGEARAFRGDACKELAAAGEEAGGTGVHFAGFA